MVLMIDNYDSFTYNLVQYFMQLGEDVTVFRNDEITPQEAEKIEFDYLVISPGPGRPQDAGCAMDMIRTFAGRKPILGVCLGHQAIGEVYGGKIVRARAIMHGKSDMVTHDGKSLFAGLPNPLRVIRYHSLVIDKPTLADEFEISATSSDQEIMAIRHKTLRIEGVQFHPESIGTEEGMKMLANFLSGVKEMPPLKELLHKPLTGKHLSRKEAGYIMKQITEGSITSAQIGSFLTSLTIKGPTVDEITGFAKVLYDKAIPVPVPEGLAIADTCGTGGDGHGTFNVSTAAAFIACGAGVKIAKHGNRSITSRCGSADVLEALGVKIDLNPQQAADALAQTGICFLYAPNYHPAFKNIMGPRKELGFRTVFNMMGPLLNPAKVTSQVMGVFDPDLTEMIAHVLSNLGVRHALVVHGADGLDEITLTGVSKVTELKDNWIRTMEFDPRHFGFDYCTLADIKGGSAAENARIVKQIFDGEKGARRNTAVVNAAAAILAADICDNFSDAIKKANESIDSGAAKHCLDQLAALSKNIQEKNS